jgi:hypothetical protein
MSRIPTHGTQLQIGDEYDYYTTVAQVQELTPPGYSTGTIVLADHDMTDIKEKLPEGLSEVTAMPAKIYWDPEDLSHMELVALAKSKDIVPIKIIGPNGAFEIDFEGFISKFQATGFNASSGVAEADIEFTPTADWAVSGS